MLVRGIRADDLNNLTSIAKNIKQGTLDGFDDGQGVAIGRRLADQLSLHAGDSITLVAPRGAVTPIGTTPRIKPYTVVAVFEIGMSEYDSSFVFMPLPEAQAYFNRDGRRHRDRGLHDNPDQVDAFRKTVTEAAGRPVFLVDWRQRNSTFFNALQVERNVMFLILTLIVLVAALNIISGLIMLVKDKGSDIAILRTMGASQGAIMRIFLITGAAIGVVGTLAGFCRRHGDLPQHRIDPAVPVLADQHRTVLAGALFPVASCRPRSISARPRRWSSWRWRCRSWRRSIRPGAPRGSIRSKRCATNERADGSRGRKMYRSFISTRSSGSTRRATATLTILNGAKLALWAGQSVALVAPSGAGKSTLLHIAGLLESPDAGEVYVGGRADLGDLSDAERTAIRRTEIGFVYQFHHLLPEFSALENVMLPQMIRGLKRSGDRKRATRNAGLSRPRRAHHPPAGGTVRRRAAAGRDRPRGRQRAAGAAGRRADRQSRSAHRRSRVRGADAAGARRPGRDADRDPQHGAGRPDGPAGVAGRTARSSNWTDAARSVSAGAGGAGAQRAGRGSGRYRRTAASLSPT